MSEAQIVDVPTGVFSGNNQSYMHVFFYAVIKIIYIESIGINITTI